MSSNAVPGRARHRKPLLAAIAAVLLAGCGTATEPSNGAARFEVLSGGDVRDTIDAPLPVALRVQLLDSTGAPVASEPVQFLGARTNPPNPVYTAFVSPLELVKFTAKVTDTTDDAGQVEVRVQLGPLLGETGITVTAERLGVSKTVTYHVDPGAPAHVRITPADSIVVVGRSYSVGTQVVDRRGNGLAGVAALSPVGSEVTFSGARLTGSVMGRGRFVAAAGSVRDTGLVSVVPTGVLAASSINGIATFELDGTAFRTVTQLPTTNLAWDPNGQEIVFDPPYVPGRLQTVNVQTGAVRFTLPNPIPNFAEVTARFARDRSWLYFTRMIGGSDYHIWRAHLDGSVDEAIPGMPSAAALRPVPSPDGTRLVYVVGFDLGVSGLEDLRMFDLVGGVDLPFRVPGHSPSWSPAGDRIAYVDVGDSQRLKVVSPDGTGRRTLAGGQTGFQLGIDWSPDGRWIVAKGLSVIELIDPDAGTVIPLPFTHDLSYPAWRP